MAVQAFNQSAFGQECSRPIAIGVEIKGGDQKSFIVTEQGDFQVKWISNWGDE